MSVKPKLPAGKGQKYEGEMRGNAQPDKFAKPLVDVTRGVSNMDSLKNDIGEMSGFQADTAGYIVKKGTPYGEAAKFNMMPPGMDISNQEMCDIRNMPLKKIMDMSYPGDGWEPAPRDIPE
jgi:hypothetical protein